MTEKIRTPRDPKILVDLKLAEPHISQRILGMMTCLRGLQTSLPHSRWSLP